MYGTITMSPYYPPKGDLSPLLPKDADSMADLDIDCGVLDMSEHIVVEVDDEELVTVVEGRFPMSGQGDPYRFGVLCRTRDDDKVLVGTDMDGQTLVVDE